MKMEKRKTIILIGPNGYFGKFILKKLIEKYFVIGISRDASNIYLADHDQKYYSPLNIDLRDFDGDDLLKKVNNLLKIQNSKLYGIVNNGYFGYPEKPDSINISEVHVAAEGIFGVQMRLIMNFKEILHRGSSIINISSMYGLVAPNQENYTKNVEVNALLYGSMKAALIQGSRWLSSIYGKDEIRVNSISFGPFPQEKIQNDEPEFIKKLSKQTHLKRIGQPEETTGIIMFLLSDDSSYITGANIKVDGGWTAW